ncbi:FAD-linked oxidoreductase-like protein [Gilbertella persicaria]|nr:FAD-linked oxidoreductase-like protein [Gilbertella persicaria]KAI8069734.1 FAD-linked oxidoreductase-like protein [Gilbertella persicaria]
MPVRTLSYIATVSAASAYYYFQHSDQDRKHSIIGPTSTQLQDEHNRVAVQARSTPEILLGLFVYKLCTFPWIADTAPYVLRLAEACHLQAPVYWFIKHTFFNQFCGGETAEECVATMNRLSQSNINCILDLSIESDLPPPSKDNAGKYAQQEHNADLTLDMIKTCLKTASQSSLNDAFAAIKLTALAPPELLLRLNQVMYFLDKAFEKYQVDGRIGRNGVEYVTSHICPAPHTKQQEQERNQILSRFTDQKYTLDYVEYTKLFNLNGMGYKVWWETDSDKTEKDVYLTLEDLHAYGRMLHRLDQVCQLAQDKGVGIMVDAEQSYFQEAIDHVAMNLQEKYNRRDDMDHSPTVYNTYQMYTKAAQKKLERDFERAERGNFAFAVKLVRGAYMISERKRAEQLNYESPIHNTIEDTHHSYNNGIRFLLGRLQHYQETAGQPLTASTAPVVFMVASHNRESTILTVEEMEQHHVSPGSGVVHFGQLFGMQDQITYTLGKNGYSVYKYLPYGRIDQVIPYLLRRAQENSSVLGGVNKELALMWQELKYRLAGLITTTQSLDGNSNGDNTISTETA